MIFGRPESEMKERLEYMQPREAKVRGGRTQGLKNVESGHLTAVVQLPQTKAQQRNGRANVKKAVESGLLSTLPHMRWHVKRGIVNPHCKFCAAPQKAA
jgi:hypothetical protein